MWSEGLERRWRRGAVLFAVLVGLFLMHGMSAGGVASGCHGQVTGGSPHAMSNSAATATTMTTVASADTGDAHGAGGDTCVPLRSDGSSSLLLALAFVAIAVWPASMRGLVAPRIPRTRRGPPRSGADLLVIVSVCRT